MPAGDQPPTQPPPEPKLLELARKKFGTLTRAEEELFRAAQEGFASVVGERGSSSAASRCAFSGNILLQDDLLSFSSFFVV